MERAALKLISTPAEPEPRGQVAVGRAPLWLGGSILLAALAATWLGADDARSRIDSTEIARNALVRAIGFGSQDPEARAALHGLRRELGKRPLDARTRALYSTVLLGTTRHLEDAEVAAFHAAKAAELAPVTAPVVRYATLVLVRTGRREEALRWARRMFAFDPAAAADVLSEVEPFLDDGEVELGLIERPEAWLAWSDHLRTLGRLEQAERRLELAHQRWPNHTAILRRVATFAYAREDWSELATLFPADRRLPQEPAAARLFAYRAGLRVERGQFPDARRDVETAIRLDGDDRQTLFVSAEVMEAIGDVDAARRHWTRAAFLAGRGDPNQLRSLVRLARLEEREGVPAGALRLWRSVLELDPQHAEARRQIDDLTGFNR